MVIILSVFYLFVSKSYGKLRTLVSNSICDKFNNIHIHTCTLDVTAGLFEMLQCVYDIQSNVY